MPQKTTSAALIRLRPLERTNTGAIVEEHIRYWNKVKDDKEAKRLAREARENLFKRQVSKDTATKFEGLVPEDNASYFQNQVVERFNERAPELAELSKRVSEGDMSAIIPYNKAKQEFASMASGGKIISDKIDELGLQISKGNINEWTNKPLLEMINSISTGKYIIDKKTGRHRVYSEDGSKIIFDGSSDQLQNSFLTSNFDEPVDFDTESATLSEGLLDTLDGNKQITPNTRIRGIQLAQNKFDADNLFARSWYENAKQKGYNVPKGKTYNELDNVERAQVAMSFYDKGILPNISETFKDTALEDEAKRLEILRKRQLLRKGEREEDVEGVTTISVTTTEEGDVIKREVTAIGQPVSTELTEDVLYTIKGKGITIDEVTGDKETRTTYTNFGRGEDGVVAIGKKVTKVPILEDDEPTGKFRDVVENVVEKDKIKLNTIATQIKNKEGKLFSNLNELDTELRGLNIKITFSAEQEKLIQENMDANPDYSREEIIKALGF